MIILILRWVLAIVIAFAVGKCVSRFRLPSILGWLITGMVLGPYALHLLPEKLMNMAFYETIIHVLECAVGFMIGTELVWKRLKTYGKALIVTTLTQSLGTFVVVSGIFCIIFIIRDVPVYLAFLFGGIALATAPAPALSIVQEFQTEGPVTKTLIPMAALDDMVGVAVFFTTVAVVARHISGNGMPLYMIPIIILLPLVIGFATGFPAGILLKKERTTLQTLSILVATILITTIIGYLCNTYLMPSPLLNFMLMGMAFSATFSNMVTEERLERIISDFHPLLGVAMIIVILNLGAPLDYHAILGAGFYTVVYIIVRTTGKYFGARFGAKIMKMPLAVQNYLGLTLLPHSGVSLVFTGIAVSILASSAPECAGIIQGTIAAAAVLNELIAVVVAKKGFEWAGEMQKANKESE